MPIHLPQALLLPMQLVLVVWIVQGDGNKQIRMKTDRIRTDITDIIFIFIFLVEFGFEYG